MSKVLIIAEAGVNHNGDFDLARKLIDTAREAEVDIVKFQTWITEELIDLNAPKAAYQIQNDSSATQYEMLKKLELSFEHFRKLRDYAKSVGVSFLSTPDDIPSLNFLIDDLQLPLIKVGSGEVTNIPYLRAIGAKRKPVILSTGMSTLAEVEQALVTLEHAGAPTVTILHCVSNYPASLESINLRAMLTMRDAFKVPVGYSDHTMGYEASLAAVALGATVIEKHYTLDRHMAGPDHLASLDPRELKEFVRMIRNTEIILSGSGRKTPHVSEIDTKAVVAKGLYAKRDIAPGELFGVENITCKRPVGKISSSHFDLVQKHKSATTIKAGTAIDWAHVMW